MKESYVQLALAHAIRLHAEINKVSSITALGKLNKKNSNLAAKIKRALKETIVQIQIAADQDRKEGIPIRAASLKQLEEFQLIFVTGLRKLDGRASIVQLR